MYEEMVNLQVLQEHGVGMCIKGTKKVGWLLGVPTLQGRHSQ